MIKETIEKSLNKQLNEELYSSYLYLAMAAWFESENLMGFSKWMKIQSQEEYGHAMKIYSYILQLNGKVKLGTIESPKGNWKNAQDVFQETYEHEKLISASIHEIVDNAYSTKDYATVNFLNWFIGEQVEEESTALNIFERLKMIGLDNQNGLLYLDRELGFRASK